MLEFKINEFLTLKLENGITHIYIKGMRFLQCKRLILDISKQDIPRYDDIDSIDEAADVYKQSLWQNRIVEGPMAIPSRFRNDTITPEQEFWGHCSNIQTWYEHNYDTRLLHSNLAFPLLRALVDAGDTSAKKMLNIEIAERFESGHPNVIKSILSSGLLDYLSPEERRLLIQQSVSNVLDYMESISKYYPNLFLNVFKEKLLYYLHPKEKERLRQLNYQVILTVIQELRNIYPKTILGIFEDLILDQSSQEELELFIQKKYPSILKNLEKIWNDLEKIRMLNPHLFRYFFDEKLIYYLDNEDKIESIQQNYPVLFKKKREKGSLILKNVHNVLGYLELIAGDFKFNQISETIISIMYATLIDAIKETKYLAEFFNIRAERDSHQLFLIMIKAIRMVNLPNDNKNEIMKQWMENWREKWDERRKKEKERREKQMKERREKEKEWREKEKKRREREKEIKDQYLKEWKEREKKRREREKEIKDQYLKEWKEREKKRLEKEQKEIKKIIKKLPLIGCRECGKNIPYKSTSILLKKERVYCPYCGRIIHVKSALISCRRCGVSLPNKSLLTLFEKKRISCPNCRRMILRKLNLIDTNRIRKILNPPINSFKSRRITRCPRCGADERNIKKIDDKSKILSYISVVPIYAKKYICKRCNYEFKS